MMLNKPQTKAFSFIINEKAGEINLVKIMAGKIKMQFHKGFGFIVSRMMSVFVSSLNKI